jgi:hypothetical protein
MASEATTIPGDLRVRGNVNANGYNFPANSIGDSQFNSANPLGATKQVHQHNERYSQVHGSAATTARVPIHTAFDAGAVIDIRAKCSVIPIGDSTVTVDLYKNGSSILTGVITLDNTVAANVSETTGITAPGTYVEDDEFHVVVTATVGTGTLPQGLSVLVVFREGSGG